MPRKPVVLTAMAAIIALGLLVDMGWRAYTKPRYVVLVDGQVLGALRRPDDALQALAAVQEQVPAEMQSQVDLKGKLFIRPLQKNDRIAATSGTEVQKALVATIPSLAYATAITVNGQDVVAVSDEKVARAVREQILDEYKSTILRDASEVEQVKFQETIDWHPKLVKAENVRTAEQAISILKHGTDRLVTYQVKRGDTGWDIARSYNVTTDQLMKANPNVNMDSLQVGQSLNVTFREPYVHTLSVSKRVVKEDIPFTEQVSKDADLWPWQYVVVTPGVPGQRELTIREYRENGRTVKTEVVDNKVLSQPKPQIAKTGTRQTPSLGTGSLVYPVVGELTSEFGPRWEEFHYGIDIAAPTGTPILAADSGMVVFAGWDGNYGNLIRIDHGGGKMVTWYGHLSRFKVGLGDTVRKGQVIGYVGSTGRSTGPHVHYEVHVDGVAVNPLRYYQ